MQILGATEAAGEGINLQVCHIPVIYDIPWNPNRPEQCDAVMMPWDFTFFVDSVPRDHNYH
ncbi:MAG TPA: hypothetical protein DEP84_25200 [Chloroflexi bacterium]|nr:hypothetical protein [Chloroflexota bacterium]